MTTALFGDVHDPAETLDPYRGRWLFADPSTETCRVWPPTTPFPQVMTDIPSDLIESGALLDVPLLVGPNGIPFKTTFLLSHLYLNTQAPGWFDGAPAPHWDYLVAASGVRDNPHGEADLSWAAPWVPRLWVEYATDLIERKEKNDEL